MQRQKLLAEGRQVQQKLSLLNSELKREKKASSARDFEVRRVPWQQLAGKSGAAPSPDARA